MRNGIVESISRETIRIILESHHLKPWRFHMWLSAKVPRDEAFCRQIQEIIELYTRSLSSDEMVLCVDKRTQLQPRPRLVPTKPAIAGLPNLVEHEYQRQGFLSLFAAFNTRTGHIYGQTYSRKRQVEFITFLEYLDHKIPVSIQKIHLVLDNYSTHIGKKTKQWLANHPRFIFHFTPKHCSWMNQVEQWFSILQRKRLRIVDFESIEHLKERLNAFITEWNAQAHSFNWEQKSVTKLMAKIKSKPAA